MSLTKSPWNIQISVGAATEPVKAYHTTSSQTASFLNMQIYVLLFKLLQKY